MIDLKFQQVLAKGLHAQYDLSCTPDYTALHFLWPWRVMYIYIYIYITRKLSGSAPDSIRRLIAKGVMVTRVTILLPCSVTLHSRRRSTSGSTKLLIVATHAQTWTWVPASLINSSSVELALQVPTWRPHFLLASISWNGMTSVVGLSSGATRNTEDVYMAVGKVLLHRHHILRID
jgi:hypothetical protein